MQYGGIPMLQYLDEPDCNCRDTLNHRKRLDRASLNTLVGNSSRCFGPNDERLEIWLNGIIR